MDPTGHWPIDTPFYKPGQSYNDTLKLYNQQKKAGNIPSQPQSTYVYRKPVNTNSTDQGGDSDDILPPKRTEPKKASVKTSEGVVAVPVYIMSATDIKMEDAQMRIVGAFNRLSEVSEGTTFEVQFVNDINDSLFVYRLRGGNNADKNNGSNYYEMGDYVDLVLNSASTWETSMNLLSMQRADEYTVIEESMHMSGMKEEHYNEHTPSIMANCPYRGTFLTYKNKAYGTGPNKQMADVIEYYLTTGKYNYTYCTYEH